MRFDELFEMRKLTGIKLKDYISDNGFSKVSFCKKTEISRPTLDKILNGEIDSKSSFDKHLNKIFTSLGIGPDTLMEFSTKTQSVDAMYSQKALINYQMNDKAKMEGHVKEYRSSPHHASNLHHLFSESGAHHERTVHQQPPVQMTLFDLWGMEEEEIGRAHV